MEKEQIYTAVNKVINEYPEAQNELLAAIHSFELSYRRKLAVGVDNYYIIAILRKEYINSAHGKAKENAALTLKSLTNPGEGKNSDMPHLKHLHPMSRTAHFRTLCTKGLVKKLSYGTYRLTSEGWQVLERAYKISKMQQLEDPDFKKYIEVIGMK